MKLVIRFELPLPAEAPPFMETIAKVFGHNPEDPGAEPVEQFICKNVCEPQIDALFRALITNSLSGYFGLAGKPAVDAVIAKYDASRSIVAEIVADS